MNHPPHILHVEDNPGDADLVGMILRETEAHPDIQVVSDGLQALAYLRRKDGFEQAKRPDLVLLDLNLPRMDGRELLKVVKRDSDLCRIPVLVLTSSDAPDDVDFAYALHANAYLQKPEAIPELEAMAQAIVRFWFEFNVSG
jgi:CheY-like chemotaxis protein